MMKSQTTKRKANKLISLLLSVVFAFSLFPLTAFALEGDGSAETPYEIGTADELMEFAQKVNGGETGAYAVLTADIDLSGTDFTPIPTFGGTFEGQGHTISGLSITGSGNVRGLFVEGYQDTASIAVKAVFRTGITDGTNGFTNDVRNINVARRRNFTDDMDHPGGH